jgi:hypothetical protein
VDRLGSFFEAQIHRVGDVLDEKSKIMQCILTLDQPHRVRIGADICDPEKQEIKRVILARIQFGQEFLGSVCLLTPLVAGSKTNLLISQLPNQCNLVIAIHPLLASCHANSTVSLLESIQSRWLNGTSSMRWNQTISLYSFDAMGTNLVRQFDRLGDEKK